MNFEAIASEAAFQIEIAWNRSRRDSAAARGRWWPHYAAFPQAHCNVAARHAELMAPARASKEAA